MEMPKTIGNNTVVLEWQDVDWKSIERRVFRLQKRIHQAERRGDIKTVRGLQKLLLKSWSARMLAARRVTQDNQGKKTAGVDGVKSLSPKARMRLVGQLKLNSKAKPARRVWIPKPGRDEKRPLGIPTIYDRALQALVKMALEPQWEAKFEPNSYGFRPGRSCQDAIGAIFNAIRCKPKWVLDADIAKCFDRIDHGKLLDKLETIPAIRRQIRAWLKAGVIDSGQLFPTDEGTPQGGVISPLLANIALHGMEESIKELVEQLPGKGSRTNRRRAVSLIRYADDFVIIHENLGVIEKCRDHIQEWLKGMGLELKEEKTHITHTQECDNPGFDFLGFNIRQHKVGKYKTGKNTHNEPLGFKTIIKPSKKAVKSHYQKLKQIVDSHIVAPQEGLIRHLNSVIRGWSNYYSTAVSKQIFSQLDELLYWKLARWGKRRHSNKTGKWVARKYWRKIGSRNWAFATRTESNPMQLRSHAETPIIHHTKVKGEASPYDGNLKYWSTRMGKQPGIPTRVSKLLKKQKGKCAHCGLTFREEDVMEIDHIIPKSKGGKDTYKNLQLLHRHCHDVKTALDGSHGSHDKSQVIEEPDEVKVSSPVLETSRVGDYPA
ncbi:group II intron reverse transcriptase/maturase [Limnospira sp. PMC 1042.18]|uniref:group II intron reverse transcriptase/maturase n=2 Tax=Limnospira TaxID=2596745 RepID=UPI0028E12C6A|nr:MULTISPECIES: group II intron reverse transcriptase/maturase [unclassified Limnospira]MDT9201026.1 group II intron reverse transcriptase/maturase [Limnospira sp. PMC 1042.18]MDT9211269.1 group II intron reverse transcriptase/maturase [Limnospira sp. PMC 1252.20]MDT9216369.1 group II intron reverse transcriptase/maturase [Limnospira sp. PMC 1256.20]MDT9241834.1 group II intron reverse transcriptase/maturase [Limnospira sp. PMC 1261.20]MDT9246845.1 group II intron reverse transcriptase/matura